jgi:acetyl-CoA/propionyl-CoA carboxylase biotin carboxyl carrier protein
MATAITFHRKVVADPAFTSDPFTVHTRWIETEFVNDIPAFATPVAEDEAEEAGRETVVVEVGGKRLEVSIFGGLATVAAATAAAPAGRQPPRYRPAGRVAGESSGTAVTSSMQGTIVEVAVEEGQAVEEGDLIVVLEAMKTEQPLRAHCAGVVKGLIVETGAQVTRGAVICHIAL